MLLDALLDELKSADAVESVKTGLLGSKEAFAPKKEAVISVIEKIRAELLEDGVMYLKMLLHLPFYWISPDN